MEESVVGEFRIGSVLARGLSILIQNIAPFGVMALVFMGILQVLGVLAIGGASQNMMGGDLVRGFFSGAFAVVLLLNLIVPNLLAAALTYGTFRALTGSPADFAACVARGLSVILPVVGVALLNSILIALGSLLFVIPGIILMVMLWVAIPVAVVERPGVIASLARSRDLTAGYRWQIFGILAVVAVASLVLEWFAAFFVAALLGHLVGWIVQALVTAAWAVFAAVAYHDLRAVKEGATIEQIVAVFD